jgi:hypothetical protein
MTIVLHLMYTLNLHRKSNHPATVGTTMPFKTSFQVNASPRPIYVKDEELPHVVYQNFKYRRVCSTVYNSVLCIIIRYPFPVDLQDPTVIYPKPVNERFYNISQLIMVDGPLLDSCRRTLNHLNITMRERIRQCLEKTAAGLDPNAVVAVYTRQRAGRTEEDWYGTGSVTQLQRVHEFFDQHAVIVLGDSLSRYISFCMSQLFEECRLTAVSSFRCGKRGSMLLPTPPDGGTPPQQQQQAVPKATSNNAGPKYDVSEADANSIWLGFVYYMPKGGANLRPAINETPSLLEMFRARGIHAGTAWTNRNTTHSNNNNTQRPPPLRPLSILFEFPIAHTQSHDLIQSHMMQVQENQERFSEMVLNVTTPAARMQLAQLGFELKHMIVFDGTPQHFPTESGAYADVRNQKSEQEFLQQQGYPGWRPEFGSTCRGPLHPNSTLKHINQMSREAFVKLQFDTDRWYGKTWEFSNQFWWEETMWKLNQLDCTHPLAPIGGGVCAHKYFLQAMIDGYYEDRQQMR